VVSLRALASALSLALALAFTGMALPGSTSGGEPEGEVVAIVDGRAIPISEVSRYYCDDFSYPVIRCSASPVVVEARASVVLLATGVNYVTIYDQANYFGTFMHVSQDYTALLSIGWNDKVSSFKGRNLESGRFWTDWFSGGTSWSFCCNTNVSSLGSYNNTFSSVHRT
jgi:hypothetical protein